MVDLSLARISTRQSSSISILCRCALVQREKSLYFCVWPSKVDWKKVIISSVLCELWVAFCYLLMCLFSNKRIHFYRSDLRSPFNYFHSSICCLCSLIRSQNYIIPSQSLRSQGSENVQTFKLLAVVKQFMCFGNSVGYDLNFSHSFVKFHFFLILLDLALERGKAYFTKKDFS